MCEYYKIAQKRAKQFPKYNFIFIVDNGKKAQNKFSEKGERMQRKVSKESFQITLL